MATSGGDPSQQWFRRLVEKIDTTGGAGNLPLDELRALVTENPDAAAESIPVLLKMGQKIRVAYQIAISIAGAYAVVTGDDSLIVTVEAEIARVPVPPAPPRVDAKGPRSGPGRPVTSSPEVWILEVKQQDLSSGDVYPLARLFPMDGADRDKALTRGRRGRFVLAYEVDDDPAPIWLIESVRIYAAQLFKQLPHFPYFLNPDTRVNSFATFFGPLADLAAIHDTAIDLTHPSVREHVLASLVAVTHFARVIDDDPATVCREILQALPSEYAAEMWRLAQAHTPS